MANPATSTDGSGAAALPTRTGVNSAVLAARGIVHRFGSTLALAGVDLDVHAGEIVGLVGANGAGKSTLIAILSGALSPTEGTVLVGGESVRFAGPADAARAGIATVQQDVDAALVPQLTVAENLVFDQIARGALGPVPSRWRIRAAAARVSPELSPAELRTPVERLGTSQKQQLLIARALHHGARVVILDEPTAALSVREQRALHDQLRALAAAGTAIIYITHHLGELTGLVDRALAIRDGVVSGEFARPVQPAEVAAAMLGPIAADAARTERPPVTGSVVVALEGVRAHPAAPALDLEVHDGEVLGITGLLGSGKTRLLRQLIGADALIDGRIELDGHAFRPKHPADAVHAGIGFVSEDRRTTAEFGDWDVARNLSLPSLRRHSRFGLVSARAERRSAQTIIDGLRIVAEGPRAALRSLSGGNRQKVMVGRWIAAGSRLLVLDEPFRGVDLGARADLAALIRSGAVRAAIVASSDPEEILEVADRILVLAQGRIVGEIRPDHTDIDTLTALMVSESDEQQEAVPA